MQREIQHSVRAYVAWRLRMGPQSTSAPKEDITLEGAPREKTTALYLATCPNCKIN